MGQRQWPNKPHLASLKPLLLAGYIRSLILDLRLLASIEIETDLMPLTKEMVKVPQE